MFPSLASLNRSMLFSQYDHCFSVCDPLRRNLDISKIACHQVEWKEEGCLLVAHIRATYISAQEMMRKLNDLGMVSAVTLKPFRVMTDKEFRLTLVQCVIL